VARDCRRGPARSLVTLFPTEPIGTPCGGERVTGQDLRPLMARMAAYAPHTYPAEMCGLVLAGREGALRSSPSRTSPAAGRRRGLAGAAGAMAM